MRKRTPQEIADFFQLYVSQTYSGDWFVHIDKPIMHKGAWISHNGIGFPNQLVDAPADHDWEQLYEPQKITPESTVINEKSDENCQKDDLCPHQSEVYPHKEYIIVEAKRAQDLAAKVNVMLAHGWEIQGGLAIEYLPESDGYVEGSEIFYQAMVRGV